MNNKRIDAHICDLVFLLPTLAIYKNGLHFAWLWFELVVRFGNLSDNK